MKSSNGTLLEFEGIGADLRNSSFGGQINNYSKDVMMEVGIKGAYGSDMAFRVRKTYDCVVKLNELLDRIFPKRIS